MLDYQKQNQTLVFFSSFLFSTSSIFWKYSYYFFFNLTVVNIVDLTVRKNNVVRSQETLLEGGFIFAVGLTNEMGLPVELCNDDDFDSGKCERGRKITFTLASKN